MSGLNYTSIYFLSTLPIIGHNKILPKALDLTWKGRLQIPEIVDELSGGINTQFFIKIFRAYKLSEGRVYVFSDLYSSTYTC